MLPKPPGRDFSGVSTASGTRDWGRRSRSCSVSGEPGGAARLLDHALQALLNLQGWSEPAEALWSDLAVRLPDELFDRLRAHIVAQLANENRLSSMNRQGATGAQVGRRPYLLRRQIT